jgi:hypothetical protein
MLRLLVALAALGAFAVMPDGASAQYYDPYYRGYYPPPPPPPYYAPRPRYRGDRLEDFRPAYIDRHGQMTFYPKRGNRCPRGYTVQDGVCKPYRGY